MNTLPKLAPLSRIWRPMIPHMLLGLTPVDLIMTQAVLKQHGVIRLDPVRGFAVWGDVDNLGAPPADRGWRLSTSADVGTPVLFDGPIPNDWTHLEVTNLTRQMINGRSRTCVRVTPHTDGRDQLFAAALEWFDTTVAPSLGSAEAAAQRLRIFDADLWDLNWGPYQSEQAAPADQA